MTDLREGRIQAFLDEEMDAEARRTFMSEMARDEALAAAVRAQRTRIERVHAALDALREGRPPPTAAETDEVLHAVLSRVGVPGATQPVASGTGPGVDGSTEEEDAAALRARTRRSRHAGAAGLAKAAGLLLFATGVAAATIPGSPVRTWLGDLGGTSAAATAVEAPTEGTVGADRTGIRLPARGGPLQVVISAPLDEPLRVSLVDEPTLEVLAGQGTSFSTSDGRIQVHEPRGAVSVRIPRAADDVSIRVAGSVFLRKSGDRVEVLHEGVDTLPSEFVFHPTGEGRPEG